MTVGIVVILGLATVALALARLLIVPKKRRLREEEMLKTVARAMELRAPRVVVEAERVEVFAMRLAETLLLTERQRHRLKRAVYVRDLGLSEVPYHLLNNAPGLSWSREDQRLFELNAQRAADFAREIPALADLAPILRERNAAFGLGQPIEARVLRVASDFAWLEREHGSAIAAEVIREGAGTEYDPEVVNACLGTLSSSHVGTFNPAAASL